MTTKVFLGKPCRRNHLNPNGLTLRYTSNGACVECSKAARKAAYDEQSWDLADAGRPRRDYKRRETKEGNYEVQVKREREQEKGSNTKVKIDNGKEWLLDDV